MISQQSCIIIISDTVENTAITLRIRSDLIAVRVIQMERIMVLNFSFRYLTM